MDKLHKESRKQFEEWIKFHSDEEECTNLLQRNNAGTNYLHPHTDLAWIAWKTSRECIAVELPEKRRDDSESAYWESMGIDLSADAIRSVGVSIKGE